MYPVARPLGLVPILVRYARLGIFYLVLLESLGTRRIDVLHEVDILMFSYHEADI